jgi:hypothetical protein
MTQLRLLSVIILSGALMGCAGPKQEKTYLQAYGYQGGRGQGFVAAPFRVSQEGHACVSGKVSGRITRLRVESLSPDLEPGLAVAVQTADQGLVHVHVGPLAFLQKREADLKPGDEVAIQALCYDLAGKERLIASQIEHKGQALKLSDAEGTPFWRTMCPPAD